jgi:hypothetical protein
LKVQNDVANVPEYRLARLKRYEDYANPPLRKPSKLFPVTVGIMAALYVVIGLYPKMVDKSEFTFDDPIFSDMSDRLVRAVFDNDTYSWKKSKDGTLVPESLCDRTSSCMVFCSILKASKSFNITE